MPGKKKFWNFFVESTRTQPEATDRHRQSPWRVHSNSPKNRRFAAGGSVHRPFSSGSVLNVLHLRTQYNLADYFTKPLLGNHFQEFRDCIMGVEPETSYFMMQLIKLPVKNAKFQKSRNKLAKKTLTCDTDRTKARTPKCRPAFGCSRRALPGPNQKNSVATKIYDFASPEKRS